MHNNNYNKNLQPYANKLRFNMTKAEACLWKYALRASGLGVPFRRERPIGRFIADFVCLPLKLVIEVDGVTHLYEETQVKDTQKDKELKEMGFEVLRFQDDVILNNIDFVSGIIRDKIEELQMIHPPAPASGGESTPQPPPAGENPRTNPRQRGRLPLRFLLSAFCFLLSAPLFSQPDSTRYCIAFYNVENLFDPEDDPEKNDDDFTPNGFYHWTNKKFYKKLNDIAKVFLAINGWAPPDIIGLAEIENANVLRKLCYNTGLKAYHYRYVHYDSPDARGIDVALLYRSDRVQILESKPIPVVFPFEPHSKNRDILYVKALIPGDTLHLFVNHWTSRFGGYGATIPKRNWYAQTLRKHVDSLLYVNSSACIIIMGDLNDYPTDESVAVYLQAKDYKKDAGNGTLFNLMLPFVGKNIGTHKSQEFWGCLDQFIVSKSLLNKESSWQIENGKAVIFDAPFLLTEDEKFGGVKTWRTYLGPKYLGGFADHLPVKVALFQIR